MEPVARHELEATLAAREELHPGTLAVCIPIVAIAGGIGHLPGLIAAFAALVIVFAIAEFHR